MFEVLGLKGVGLLIVNVECGEELDARLSGAARSAEGLPERGAIQLRRAADPQLVVCVV